MARVLENGAVEEAVVRIVLHQKQRGHEFVQSAGMAPGSARPWHDGYPSVRLARAAMRMILSAPRGFGQRTARHRMICWEPRTT
jgi:hypothetical protein